MLRVNGAAPLLCVQGWNGDNSAIDNLEHFEVRHLRCVSNKLNVKCIQYDVKHNLELDGILVYYT